MVKRNFNWWLAGALLLFGLVDITYEVLLIAYIILWQVFNRGDSEEE